MEIKLGGKRGGMTQVSPKDYEILSKYAWHHNGHGYACSKINGKNVLMHRFLMNPLKGQVVDHINGNCLDNRRENLRITTSSLNSQNRHKTKINSTSKYKGVFKNSRGTFTSKIAINRKTIFIGNYQSEEKAAEALDMYIVHNKLDHITLNFPEKRNGYLNREYIIKNKQENSTGYYGVYRLKDNMFKAMIINKKIKITIKNDKDPKECAMAYDNYIINNSILGKKINFPDNHPNYLNAKHIKTLYEPINETTIKLIISNNNHVCVTIDKDDYDKIKYYNCVVNNRHKYIDVIINSSRYRLHRIIMDVTDPEIFIDHINGNINDNTRNNLRLSDAIKNSRNRKKQDNTSSKYLGVHRDKRSNLWKCNVMNNGKLLFNKYFDHEIDAARYRDLCILTHFPDEHYKLNFEWTKEDKIIWKDKLDNLKLTNKRIGIKKTASKYTGVYYNDSIKKWTCKVIYTNNENNKKIFNRSDDSEENTVRVRDLFILKHSLENHRKLNFVWTQEEIIEWTVRLNFMLNLTKNKNKQI